MSSFELLAVIVVTVSVSNRTDRHHYHDADRSRLILGFLDLYLLPTLTMLLGFDSSQIESRRFRSEHSRVKLRTWHDLLGVSKEVSASPSRSRKDVTGITIVSVHPNTGGDY